MLSLFLKYLFIPVLLFAPVKSKNGHPIFMSVTEIEHNAKEKSLEVSSKIYTDDFEKILRTNYKVKIDLINKTKAADMDKYVNDYIQKHLKLTADGKLQTLKYIGYEKIEDAINIYLEAEKIETVKKIELVNNILYDYKTTQISLMHVSVGGNRQSKKLVNPETNASFVF
jgi:hypothetical protein